ncbi:MAG: hypothetical protein B6U85_10460 [Desulfurococcales archaeon ex4484_42]|nr:MAG: hypothetical protein B6U85_10460 [Desulfurococcales archaeon ex4484_42]
MVLTAAEKRKILETLEKDKEFRYALMGYLGFREVLDRIARIEERQQKLEERQQRLEERMVRLEERQQRLEERQQRLEERFAKLEERFIRLEERQQKLEERIGRVEEELRDFKRFINVIAHRFGVITKDAFRESMKYVIEEALGVARVGRWVYEDRDGYVYGHSSIIEVDLVVRDREHILIEVKSRVGKDDLAELKRIGELYEKVMGVRPKLVMISGFMDRGVKRLAKALGIELRPVTKDFEEGMKVL